MQEEVPVPEAGWQGQEFPFSSDNRRDRMPIEGILLLLIIQIAFYEGIDRHTDKETERQRHREEGVPN